MGKQVHKRVAHGKSNTPEYRAWHLMKSRCLNRNFHKYPQYGGRGIKICERWVNSFVNFFADMGPRPSSEHSIDRKNTNGDYTPDNCRWATPTEQTRNRGITVTVEFEGKAITLAEVSLQTGIGYTTLYNRIARGMSIDDAVQKPLVAGRKRFTPQEVRAIREEYESTDLSQSEIAKRRGVTQRAISQIVRREVYVNV